MKKSSVQKKRKLKRTLIDDESTDSECDYKNSPVKKVKKEDPDMKMALVKPREQMSLIEIINDKHSGIMAPSEIERRRVKMDEKRLKKEKPFKKEEKITVKEVKEEKNEKNINQRPQVVIVNGKPKLIKPENIKEFKREIVDIDHQDRKLSSLQYLRPSKRHKALRWTEQDEQKFYDALKIFGENCDMIYSVIFCPEKAKVRYENPEEFSERSIV